MFWVFLTGVQRSEFWRHVTVLFRINALLEAGRSLEGGRIIEGAFIEKKNHKKGGVYSKRCGILNFQLTQYR